MSVLRLLLFFRRAGTPGAPPMQPAPMMPPAPTSAWSDAFSTAFG